MEEIYQAIETLIKGSGYPKVVSGADIYSEICDEIEDKENGSYIFMSKSDDDDIFEYQVTIMDENFNLSKLVITSGETKYTIEFDD